MSGRRKPWEVAYAETLADVETLLRRAGAEHATEDAVEFMRRLVAGGWRHVRPDLEPVPDTGPPAPVDVVAARAAAAREQIHHTPKETDQ